MPEDLNSFVTIATFGRPAEAEMAKELLDREGIPCVLADENVVGMNWLYSTAVGGVKLQVKRSDVPRVLELLNLPIAVIPPDQYESDDTDVPRCPKCFSEDIAFEKFSRKSFIISWLLIGVPFSFLKKRWFCRKCGNKWK